MLIYKATNSINGKSYIGQTAKPSIEPRKNKHFKNAFKDLTQTHFYRALRKYGKDNFTWEILCYCNTKEELNQKEIYYIEYFQSMSFQNGYNMTKGGTGGDTWTYNFRLPELKKLKSLQTSGKNNPMYGRDRKQNYLLVSPEGIQFSCNGILNIKLVTNKILSKQIIANLVSKKWDHYRGWQVFNYNSTIDIKHFNELSEEHFIRKPNGKGQGIVTIAWFLHK